MKNEIEARLLECDVKAILKKLKTCNASLIGDWVQIRNCYDFNPVKENSWIRLRTNGIETTLTIKELVSKEIDGTKECEIVVSNFEKTDELLNKLGYFARNKQENRRIRFVLDSVEIDIDFWPMIPAYIEFEADSEEKIKAVCAKLDINFNDLTTLDVQSIYKSYGIDLNKFPTISLENEKRCDFKL